MPATSLRERGDALLASLYGTGARFRDGQWEAIADLLEGRRRVLVVQRTGWGKSLVYFIATKLLRERGGGPTILISPLLSLMRNQVQMANGLGVRAVRLDSTNPDEWREMETALAADVIDLLMVSPERLANEHFQTVTFPAIKRGVGLFVVDEAHCISDWGHDFRPDYQRIAGFVQQLPAIVPLLATTATANARVVDDIVRQLGREVAFVRGALARRSLRLQNIRLGSQAERMAWLAGVVPTLPGHGIIYCSTTRDCDRVSAWLKTRGIDAPAYYGAIGNREELEQRLLGNDVKALVATVALGMGFDKPDLSFVVHFQKPGSVVDYYQRIGRAGRALDDAAVVLLSGNEDDEINDYFIASAFPAIAETEWVIAELERAGGLRMRELQERVNFKRSHCQQILKMLEVEGAVYRDAGTYRLSAKPWVRDQARVDRVTAVRRHEQERMRQFLATRECLMAFLTRELDDPESHPCGRCANCTTSFVPTEADAALTQDALEFLKRSYLEIEPRKQLATGKKIPESQRAEAGRALCYYGDAGHGSSVRRGKYQDHRFGDDLVRALVDLVRNTWRPQPAPAWITAVPSLRRPRLVPDLAERVAADLGLPYRPALQKVHDTPEQKTMENSAHQAGNVAGSFAAVHEQMSSGAVLLIDDMADSRWTLTECARVLRDAGSGPVFPIVLAISSGGDDD